jgi:hypothetical protein
MTADEFKKTLFYAQCGFAGYFEWHHGFMAYPTSVTGG